MKLNQFYTPPECSDALVSNLDILSPEVAVDLGFGEGELLKAAKRKWGNLKLIGIDVDKENVKKCCPSLGIDAFIGDGFDPELPSRIKRMYGEIDLLISNPPFFSSAWTDNTKNILMDANLEEIVPSLATKIPAEVVFLAQNLRLMSKTSELAIILPAGIASGEGWVKLRKHLFTNYNVKCCIQLPIGAFGKTDAQTFIFILNKNLKLNSGSVILLDFESESQISIPRIKAIERCDFNYHASELYRNSRISLSENSIFIRRGNLSRKYLNENNIEHLHTTDMPKFPSIIDVEVGSKANGNKASNGDILIARVGTRCLGRVALVKGKSIHVSDCIIVLKIKDCNLRDKVWSMLSNNKFKTYINKVALGVGAKYITHKIIREYLFYYERD
ncbi:MAG: N-6 DNA methylase [Psychrobium sp.]